MKIPILIEPIDDGKYRAHAGSPFSLSADGSSEQEATELLTRLLHHQLHTGARISVIELGNGVPPASRAHVHFDPLPEDDWFFQTMNEAIAKNREAEGMG